MKLFASLLSAVLVTTLLSAVNAQTQIGNVTLTKPGAPATAAPAPTAPSMATPGMAAPKMTTPGMAAPAAGQRSSGSSNLNRVSNSVSTTTASTIVVPAGSQEVRGRVMAASGAVRLPAGSRVNVSVHDLTRPAQVVQVSFGTTRLSTPYQMVFSPGRLNSAHTYAVEASVVDASGKVLYTSDRSATVPNSRRAEVNVTVR